MIPAVLLSAYEAGSHRRWARGLVRASADVYQWDHRAMAPRHFDWRVQGNALHWRAQTWGTPACLVVTSMTDLCALQAMVPPLRVPSLWYAHENQFAYPKRPDARPSPNAIHHQMRSIMGALCATTVAFNSAFNRRTFLQGARDVLAHMPDFGHPECVDEIEAKSHVLPVPLEDELRTHHNPKPTPGPVRILWNHRWEYDKAPERFFDAMEQLDARGRAFELVVVGQRFKRAPAVFERARERLEHRTVQWGYVPDQAAYHDLVASCDLVVSTALHEFQGLAVQEAMALGVRPVVPDRLAYVEHTDPAQRYASHPEDPTKDTRALIEHIEHLLDDARWRAHRPAFREAWSWGQRAQDYMGLLQALC